MKFFALLLLAASAPVFAAPPRILFDTDITGDVDDVLALAMCHSLADRGVCEWNTARVICQGTIIEHWLNEERVLSLDYTDPKWKWYVDLLEARKKPDQVP